MTQLIGKGHNVICDICGIKLRASRARKTWDGLLVCPQDWSPKPPSLDPRRNIQENRPLRDVRPEPTNSFITVASVSYSTASNGDFEHDNLGEL